MRREARNFQGKAGEDRQARGVLRRRPAGFGLGLAVLAGAAGCASPRATPADPEAPVFAPFSERVPATEATFAEYARIALERNPAPRAAYARFHAALQRVPQARALPHPSLSFEYFLEQTDTRYRVGLTQMLPAFGKRGLRENAAAAEAEATGRLFEAEQLLLVERLAKAFYDYGFLARAIDVTGQHLRLLEELEKAVDARYRSGTASLPDAIAVRIERDRMADRLASLRDQRQAQSAGLAALLNLPDGATPPVPRMEDPRPLPDDDAALAAALDAANPELLALDARRAAARHRAALARREGRPDLMLGAGAMVMPGMDGERDATDIGLMVGVSLPVRRGRIRAAEREAEALQEAAELERDALRQRLRADLSAAIFEFRDAERRRTLFADALLPQARQALTVTRQAYADGGAEFTAVIEAQRRLLDLELRLERAASDREIAYYRILRLIGQPLGWPSGDPPARRPTEGSNRLESNQ